MGTMSSVTIAEMRGFLSMSISSLNKNKLNGMKAEIDFRQHVAALKRADRVSPGGWIFRSKGAACFGEMSVAVFPQVIDPDRNYARLPRAGSVPLPLHTICATLHQIGIRSFYAFPLISLAGGAAEITWHFMQLGVPWRSPFVDVHTAFSGFQPRKHRYNYLRYKTNTTGIVSGELPTFFSQESLRVFVETVYRCETSDIDGIIWGERFTYPVEVKEKTAASDSDLGDWFGLDIGPFVKLAHYAARRGNLHALFVVKEIDDVSKRNVLNWLVITFDRLAHYASWVPRAGGTSMAGGRSMVVRVPRSAFDLLDAARMDKL